MTTSRGLRETVVRALAKVGLIWALAVLGVLFVAVSAQATSYSPSATPDTAGLVLLLAVLAGGAMVLLVGAARAEREAELPPVDDPDPLSDLPTALGLGLLR